MCGVLSSSYYQAIGPETPLIWDSWESLQTPGRPGTLDGARNRMLPVLPSRKASCALDAPEPTTLVVDPAEERLPEEEPGVRKDGDHLSSVWKDEGRGRK